MVDVINLPNWSDHPPSRTLPLAPMSDFHDDSHTDPPPAWTRHGLIISGTSPGFFLMAIFFALRWVLIGGERARDFQTTAILFAIVGVVLLLANVALRRHLELTYGDDSDN